MFEESLVLTDVPAEFLCFFLSSQHLAYFYLALVFSLTVGPMVYIFLCCLYELILFERDLLCFLLQWNWSFCGCVYIYGGQMSIWWWISLFFYVVCVTILLQGTSVCTACRPSHTGAHSDQMVKYSLNKWVTCFLGSTVKVFPRGQKNKTVKCSLLTSRWHCIVKYKFSIITGI